MRRKRKATEFERTIDANQIVGVNFRLARELRGWTQEEAARRLEPYLGQLLPKASISAIERVLERDRRRGLQRPGARRLRRGIRPPDLVVHADTRL